MSEKGQSTLENTLGFLSSLSYKILVTRQNWIISGKVIFRSQLPWVKTGRSCTTLVTKTRTESLHERMTADLRRRVTKKNATETLCIISKSRLRSINFPTRRQFIQNRHGRVSTVMFFGKQRIRAYMRTGFSDSFNFILADSEILLSTMQKIRFQGFYCLMNFLDKIHIWWLKYESDM